MKSRDAGWMFAYDKCQNRVPHFRYLPLIQTFTKQNKSPSRQSVCVSECIWKADAFELEYKYLKRMGEVTCKIELKLNFRNWLGQYLRLRILVDSRVEAIEGFWWNQLQLFSTGDEVNVAVKTYQSPAPRALKTVLISWIVNTTLALVVSKQTRVRG